MSPVKKKIKDVAIVALGHTFRQGFNLAAKEAIRIIQVKDISESGELLSERLDRIDHKFSREIELAKQGDIVFCPREHKLVAAFVKKDLGTTVIAAPLILIRITDPALNPEFLHAYLNSPKTISRLKGLLMGSFIQVINKADLIDFEVEIPDLNIQELYAKIYQCSQEENKLRDKLNKLWKEEVNGIISQSFDQLLTA